MEAELALSAEREASLARELGRCKAECCELQSKLANAVESASKAKKAARDALIDMAEQNAKLVAAYVEKKREVKQLQAAAREDRKIWQQRLQKMEHELQANKLHITALMQQLHALAAKQMKTEQSPAAPTPCSATSPICTSNAGCNGVDSSASRGYQSPGEVTSRTVPVNNTGKSPLSDATNTFTSATRTSQQKHSTSERNCNTDKDTHNCPFEHVALKQPASSAKAAAAANMPCDQGDQIPEHDQAQQLKDLIDQCVGSLQSSQLQRDGGPHAEAMKQQQQQQKQHDQAQQLKNVIDQCLGNLRPSQPQHDEGSRAEAMQQQQQQKQQQKKKHDQAQQLNVFDQCLGNLQPSQPHRDGSHAEAAEQQQQQQQKQQQQPIGKATSKQQQQPVRSQQPVQFQKHVTQHTAADQQQAVVQEQQQQDRDQELQVLQQRAEQLEAENAALRQAQAEADALRRRVQCMQQAEQLKQSGNRYYQSHQYSKAHQSYSDALALNVEDPTFNAVLLCNRAAALHSLGQYLDAIADCCMAAQLDKNYPRVLQRRAEAYMAIDDYSNAIADLQRLVELSSSKEAAQKLKDAQLKLRAQGSAGPNYYMVLGLQQSCSASEVKAAYKKLALRYHPDKVTAGLQAKAASEAVFVLITAANSVLADPVKRAAYDANQQAARIRRSMSSSSNGIGSYRHMGRENSSTTGGGMYNWHQAHAASGFRGSYAGSSAAAAERWRAAASQHVRQSSNSGQSRNTEGTNSSASSGASYNAFT